MIDTGTAVSINGTKVLTGVLTGLSKAQCLDIALALSPELAALVEAMQGLRKDQEWVTTDGAVMINEGVWEDANTALDAVQALRPRAGVGEEGQGGGARLMTAITHTCTDCGTTLARRERDMLVFAAKVVLAKPGWVRVCCSGCSKLVWMRLPEKAKEAA